MRGKRRVRVSEGAETPGAWERTGREPEGLGWIYGIERGLHRSWPRLPLVSVITWIGLLAAWEIASILFGKTTVGGEETVPSIESLVKHFDLLANYWKGGFGVTPPAQGGEITLVGALLGLAYNTWVTVYRLLAGFAIGLVVGIGLAVGISWSATLRNLVALPAHFARMMPMLAVVPLFTLWFGNTDRGAIVFIAFSTAVVLFVITLNALGNVPTYYHQYARSLGASEKRVYFGVVLPAIMPQLRPGILLALGFGWSAAIAAELLGQQYGLGRIVVDASFFGRTSVMALVGVITIIYAGVSYVIAARLLARLVQWAD